MSLPCADHRDEGIFHTQGIGTSPSLAAEVEVVWVKNGSIGLVGKNYISLLGAGVVKRPRYLDTRRLVRHRETGLGGRVGFPMSLADHPKSGIVLRLRGWMPAPNVTSLQSKCHQVLHLSIHRRIEDELSDLQ